VALVHRKLSSGQHDAKYLFVQIANYSIGRCHDLFKMELYHFTYILLLILLYGCLDVIITSLILLQEHSQQLGDDKNLSEHLKLPIQRINDYQLLLKVSASHF